MSKRKILVVEDDKETQLFLRYLLRKEYEVDICGNEISFLNFLTGKKYDLIVMDIELRGEKDGLQIIKEIKNAQKFSQIPVICLSGHVFEKDRKRAISAGADLFLSKPVDNDVLMNAIREMIG